MPVTTDRIARLRGFGLSEYAARAYLALLDLGTTEARDVAALSKVPASKVYNILEQLHEKGLVLILPEFPRKYAPVPFEEFLDRLSQEHATAAANIQKELEGLTELFAVAGDASRGDRPDFALVRGRRNVVERLVGAALETRQDILLVGPSRVLREPGLSPALQEVAARGATVRLLVPGSGQPVMPPLEARTSALPLGGERGVLLISDAQRAVIGDLCAPGDGRDEGMDSALSTSQEGIVSMLGSLVEGAWRAAMPVEGSLGRPSHPLQSPVPAAGAGLPQTPPRP